MLQLKCENCSKSFSRQKYETSEHNYCSVSCAAITNNKKFPKRPAPTKIRLIEIYPSDLYPNVLLVSKLLGL